MFPVGQKTAGDPQQDLDSQEKCGDKTEQRHRQADGVRQPGPPSPVPIFRTGHAEDLLSGVQAPVAWPF